jgi:hypothetical protein
MSKQTAAILVSGATDITILVLFSLAVFWRGFSPWWWILALVFLHGNCVCLYKILGIKTDD